MINKCLAFALSRKRIIKISQKISSTNFPKISYGFFLFIKKLPFFSISIKFIDSRFNMVNLIHSSHENHFRGLLIPYFKVTIWKLFLEKAFAIFTPTWMPASYISIILQRHLKFTYHNYQAHQSRTKQY